MRGYRGYTAGDIQAEKRYEGAILGYRCGYRCEKFRGHAAGDMQAGGHWCMGEGVLGYRYDAATML